MTIKEKVRQEEAEIVAHIEEANRQHAMQKKKIQQYQNTMT